MRDKIRLAVGAMALGATAALAGDPEQGAVLATDHCARCHDVFPGGAFKTFPPSFASIGTYRNAEQITARIWLPPMHATMPAGVEILDAANVANLVAYITSLDGTAR